MVLCACCRAALQDPARVRLHEEMTRLTRRINVSNTELDNLSKASKAQAKKLSKLQKDLAALHEARVSESVGVRPAQDRHCTTSGSRLGQPSLGFACSDSHGDGGGTTVLFSALRALCVVLQDALDDSQGDGGVQLDPAQLAEYRQLKTQADDKARGLLQEKTGLEAQLKVGPWGCAGRTPCCVCAALLLCVSCVLLAALGTGQVLGIGQMMTSFRSRHQVCVPVVPWFLLDSLSRWRRASWLGCRRPAQPRPADWSQHVRACRSCRTN